jgi:Zn-finger nucleic acid-binding protein
MSARAIGGLSAWECPRCHGLWVPGDNFDGLIRRAIESQRLQPSTGLGAACSRPTAAFQTEVVYRCCPVCRGAMQRKNFARTSGIIVDWCGAHGTWLDADELEHIADFVGRGGLAPREGATRSRSAPANASVVEATLPLDLERARREAIRNLPSENTSTIGDLLLSLLG